MASRTLKNAPRALEEQILLAIQDAFQRLLFPSLGNELLKAAKEKADDAAIAVFSKTWNNSCWGRLGGETNIGHRPWL